jgi:hypothetical protein
MDDDAKQQTLLSALVTEHFVRQSARGPRPHLPLPPASHPPMMITSSGWTRR